MELTHLLAGACLLLSIILSNILSSDAKPVYSLMDSYGDDDYYMPYGEPVADYRMGRLRRGYYYVDDGYITAVPSSAIIPADRRQDTAAAARAKDVRYNPLVSVHQTRTKRKKLFVPNLYG